MKGLPGDAVHFLIGALSFLFSWLEPLFVFPMFFGFLTYEIMKWHENPWRSRPSRGIGFWLAGLLSMAGFLFFFPEALRILFHYVPWLPMPWQEQSVPAFSFPSGG